VIELAPASLRGSLPPLVTPFRNGEVLLDAGLEVVRGT
jgi:hypothetical protein